MIDKSTIVLTYFFLIDLLFSCLVLDKSFTTQKARKSIFMYRIKEPNLNHFRLPHD